MKRTYLLLLAAILVATDASAFCGFFVAKADGKLFNKSSQVIIARDGNNSTITMSNDFKGDVKDFAMVVPVPVVLKREQIRTVGQDIFTKVDAYSAPRLAEYYDENPCYYYDYVEDGVMYFMAPGMEEMSVNREKAKEDTRVKIEARYEVDEYDILILSAKESDGLKSWLDENGYKLPEKAEEVLDPYIKSGLKFFVAKVNLDRHNSNGVQLLSPLQISFESNKFMLPIRLGMANANGDQDLIIHAYTRKGRVECTNYRTVKMPHDVHVPEFVQNDFGHFYKSTFERMYTKETGRAVFLEYAWDVSPRVRVKCDPCVGPPPLDANLVTVGCDWINEQNPSVFYTRLHVRYNRGNFPQDLFFQNTPNSERFQCRYVITHPATGELECEQGQQYLQKLVINREDELHQLAMLTGWDISNHSDYVEVYKKMIKDKDDRDGFIPEDSSPEDVGKGDLSNGWQIWLIAVGGILLLLFGYKIKELKRS